MIRKMGEERKGLTKKEARKRLLKFGPNELKRKKKEFSSLKLLVSQFKSPLIYVLVFAGLVTLFLKEFVDSTVIFAAVFLNTTLGFFQERKAQKALEALRSFLVSKTKVIRDGQRKTIDTRDLVPGDLIILEIGSRVPADGILVEATDLSINEAILTGESMPVEKKIAVKHPRGGVAPAAHRGGEKRLKILKAHLEKEKIIIDQVQLEGKKPISFKQFLAGHHVKKFV